MAHLIAHPTSVSDSWPLLPTSSENGDAHSGPTMLRELPPRYSSLEQFSNLPTGASPRYSTIFGGGSTIIAQPSPPVASTSRTTTTERVSSPARLSSIIESYPIDLQPNLDPQSKEVRAHLNTLPVPFSLSAPLPQPGVKLEKKSGSYPNEKPAKKDTQIAPQTVHPPPPLTIYQHTPPSSAGSTTNSPTDTHSDGSCAGHVNSKITKHVFQLRDSKDFPWLTLSIDSRARNAQSTPVFHGEDAITGSVHLTADSSSSSIQAVTLTIVGQLITSAYEEGIYTFMEHTSTIWTKASHLGKSSVSISSAQSTGGSAIIGSRLLGGYTWPICIPFPDEVGLERGKNVPAQLVQPPPSILEKSVNASIKYELILRVCRGRFKSDSRLKTPVIYVPKIIPKPASPLIQLSYRQNAPLPGPKVDQEGWHTLTSVTVRGRIGDRRDAQAQYTLSVANPLCYARGSVVPLSLAVESQQSDVLDTLSSPNVNSVVLKRRVKYYRDASFYSAANSEDGQLVETEAIADAIWWTPAKDGLHATTEKRLEGEIHLNENLLPTSNFPLFVIEYFVILYPPEGSNFQPESRNALATQRIRVGTVHPVGCPIPRSFTTEPARRRTSLNIEKRQSQAKSKEDPYAMWAGYGSADLTFNSAGVSMNNTLKDQKFRTSKRSTKAKFEPIEDIGGE